MSHDSPLTTHHSRSARLVHVYHDLLVRRGHETVTVEVSSAVSVEQAVQMALLKTIRPPCPPHAADRCAVVLNGQPLPPGHPLRSSILGPGDELRVGPPAPGFETALLLALAVGSALASAALAPKVSAQPLTGNDPEERRYGFGRFSQDAIVGDAVPVPFGFHPRWGGKTVLRASGEGPDGDARARILICLAGCRVNRVGSMRFSDSAGGFTRLRHDQVTGVFINDRPIATYPGARVSVRFGTSDQAAIPGFDDIERPRDVGGAGVVLRNTSGSDRAGASASGEVYTLTTDDPVDAVTLRVEFPQGLYWLSERGERRARKVAYRVRTRTVGSGSGGWGAWTSVNFERADQQPVVSVERIAVPSGQRGTRVDVQVERVTAEAAGEVASRTVDSMSLTQFVEVRDSAQRYPGYAMLALELVAGEQLTSAPSVSVELEGCNTLRIHDGTSPPTAPAFTVGYSDLACDVALAIATDAELGMGRDFTDANIDWTSFLSWRARCNELVPRRSRPGQSRRRFTTAFTIERRVRAMDALRAACATGDCQPLLTGDLLRFVFETPLATAVERFDHADLAVDDRGRAILEISYEPSRGSTPEVGRYNQLTVQFASSSAEGRPDSVTFPRDGTFWLGSSWPEGQETPRPKSTRLDHVSDLDQAADWCVKEVKKTRNLSRSVEFTTTKAVVCVQPGERFDLACTVVGWGVESGRVEPVPAPAVDRFTLSSAWTPPVVDAEYHAEVQFADGTREARRILAVSTLSGKTVVTVTPPLSRAPGAFDAYVLGRPEILTKPFTCTRVAPVEDGGRLLWEVAGVEYDGRVFDPEPGDFTLPPYSDLVSPATPPGPVSAIRAVETVLGDSRRVEVFYSQRPVDRSITAYFRIFRRLSGTAAWIPTPTLSSGLAGSVLELADDGAAYDFIAVAYTHFGRGLSPGDPRHPVSGVVYGAFRPPPAAPGSLTLTNTGGNTYRLDWPAVAGAVGYQVLTGGAATSRVNAGAEDCLVLARTTTNSLAGIELPPGDVAGWGGARFFVRSVGSGTPGRISAAAAAIAASGTVPAPPGTAVKFTRVFDLAAEGARSNCAWTASPTFPPGAGARLRMTDATAAGGALYTSPVVDSGALSVTELTVNLGTAHDTQDPTMADGAFSVPGVEADQWGVVGRPGTAPGVAAVSLLMPPYPDDRQSWFVEVRTSQDNTVWSDWAVLASRASVSALMRYVQVRVTFKRGNGGTAFPYRPAVRTLAIVGSA